MRDGAFSLISPAEEIITSESLRETYHVDVRVEFISVAGRKVCIPMKNKPGCYCSLDSSKAGGNDQDTTCQCNQGIYG